MLFLALKKKYFSAVKFKHFLECDFQILGDRFIYFRNSPELFRGYFARLPLPLGDLQQRHVELEQRGGREDHQPDEVRVDGGEDGEVLAAEVLLALQRGLVHVLDEVALGAAVHLHQLVLARHHVVVVGVQQRPVLLQELLAVLHITLRCQLLRYKNILEL